jgi:glycosyltransferase involved in cell wall biosynthesis
MQFTVITPTYQRRALLPEAIASVRASITAPLDIQWEHLLYEGGSTDGTAGYLAQAVDQPGPPLRYWQHPERQRPGWGRNKLIAEAQSEIQRHPGRPWLVADFLRVDQERRYLPGEDYYAWKFDSPREMLQAIFRAEHFIQGNVCYSRELFDKVGGYDEELDMAEDLDLYVRFLLAGHLPVLCPHISHLHRFHQQNVSIGVDADKHRADLQVIYAKYADQLKQLGVGEP